MFKLSLTINGVKEEYSDDFSFDFSSWIDFPLLWTHDGGPDSMDVSVNVIIIFKVHSYQRYPL